jgi:hypothetical protein
MTQQPLNNDQIRSAVAATFDQFEPTETRTARWETAALAAGREVDRNALSAYMAVADAEQQALADDWAKSAAAADAEIRRLRAELATARTAAFCEAADIAEGLRQFERTTGPRAAAQISENVGILRVADELRSRAAAVSAAARP